MNFRSVTVVLTIALLATSLQAEEQDLGVLDPGAGTVTTSIFPALPECGGEHDLDVWFVPLSYAPRFRIAEWLTVPSKVKLTPDQPYIDVTLPLGQITPGTYTGAVFYRCAHCSAAGDCAGKVTTDMVRVEVAAPATFGASGADKDFSGLVNGQPVSIHDLTVNVINEIKGSTFMQLAGADKVMQTLEEHYADRRVHNDNLSDITFVKTVGTTSRTGSLGAKVEPIDDEEVAPGNGRYVLARSAIGPNDEEIYIGVDVSLKGIAEARKKPQDYYVFTIDGQMGVIDKADFVHGLIHEGFHAALGGQYNTADKDGNRGACLEEEQEGFRVGNAAARALGLPEDTTTAGANYGGCSNPGYPVQFPELVAGQEAKDPTRRSPKVAGKPVQTGAAPAPKTAGQGHCRLERGGLTCEGAPGYALACDPATPDAHACTLQGTKLAAPCTFGAGGWSCAKAPAAVVSCTGGRCKTADAGPACTTDGKGTAHCTALPAYRVDCRTPGNCELVDPHSQDAALATAAKALYAATQSADCNRAGTGEFLPLAPLGTAAGIPGNDLLASVRRAFKIDDNPPQPAERFFFQFSGPFQLPEPRWPLMEPDERLAVDSSARFLRGVVDVTPASTGTFDSRDAVLQLQGLTYTSVNLPSERPVDPLVRGFVSQSLDIDGQPYTSLLIEDPHDEFVLETLRAQSIRYEPNPCRGVLVPTDPNYRRTGRHGGNSWGEKVDDQWAIKRVGFTSEDSSAWNLVKPDAAPVVVAVIDTGLDWYHADLDPASLWHNEQEIAGNGVDDDRNGYVDDIIGWNFVGGDNKPWDHDGHGTFVTGIMAARHNDAGIAGIAPNARIMVLKGVGNFGTTRASWLAEAIVYAVNNGARIINLSVGGPHESAMERAALEYAHRKGVLVVAAAGNSGEELADFGPGGHDSVLTVGASAYDNSVADFSNFGDKVDLVAPGVEVLSLRARATDVNFRPWQEPDYQEGAFIVGDDRRYVRASGTSFSTPMVAGTAALLLGNSPTLSASQVANILTSTATDLGRPGRDARTGHGMLDARAALGVVPGFRIEAKISRVDVAPAATPAGVEVFGTVDATRFKRAWLQIGAGENPEAWRYVGPKLKLPVRDGRIATLALGDFESRGPWTVVVNVEDKTGVVRRGAFLVRIP